MDLVPRIERSKYKVTTRIRTRASRNSLYFRAAALLLLMGVLAYFSRNAAVVGVVSVVGVLTIGLYAYDTRPRLDWWVETAIQREEGRASGVELDDGPPKENLSEHILPVLSSTNVSSEDEAIDNSEAEDGERHIVVPDMALHEPVKAAASITDTPPPKLREDVTSQPRPAVPQVQRKARMSFLRGLFARPVLGIDVGNSQIKIVELEQSNPPRILRYAIVPTPRGSVENGLIRRPDELSEAINEALMLGRFTTRRTATTLTGQNLMLRELKLPPMPKKEMRAAINWQIDQFLQLSQEDTLTDFSIMPSREGEETSVMLVAMQKEPILKFVDYMKGSGFNVSRVDIEPLSVFRATILATKGEVNQGTHLICDFGAGTTNISIFKEGLLQAARVITMGGNQFTRTMMVEHNLDFSEAASEKIKHGLGTESPYYSSLVPIRDRLFSEISTTVNFYLSENKGVSIDTVQIVGGNSVLPGMPQQLEATLRDALSSVSSSFRVNVANPLPHMIHEVPRAKSEWSGVALCVAIGLALGEV